MIRAVLIALLLAAPALAEPRATVALTPGWVAEGARTAGLTVTLAPGWKTYWRHPGEAGVAPQFDWSDSENLASVEVLWPSPIAFDSYGMTTLGYEHAVTLPLRLTAQDPAAPIRLRLTLFYGVCEEICVPETADLALDIAAEAQGGEAAIRAALDALPMPAGLAGVAVEHCTLAGAGEARRFEGRFALPPGPAPLAAVVEGPEGAVFGAAELHRQGDLLQVGAELAPWGAPVWIDRAGLRVTLIGPQGAVEVGCTD